MATNDTFQSLCEQLYNLVVEMRDLILKGFGLKR